MWGGLNNNLNFKPKYVNNNHKNNPNNISIYAKDIIKTELDRYDNRIINDINLVVNNGCFYIPNLICDKYDKTIFDNIMSEIKKNDKNIISWSKHFKYDNPSFILIFGNIIDKLSKYFNVTICETRLNYYPDKYSWKPLHRDSHRMHYDGEKHIKENFTMGVSFGGSRELIFKHEETNKTFKFPQHNGDCFAFTSEVNNKFLHGVPKTNIDVQPRFSFIAWGYKN